MSILYRNAVWALQAGNPGEALTFKHYTHKWGFGINVIFLKWLASQFWVQKFAEFECAAPSCLPGRKHPGAWAPILGKFLCVLGENGDLYIYKEYCICISYRLLYCIVLYCILRSWTFPRSPWACLAKRSYIGSSIAHHCNFDALQKVTGVHITTRKAYGTVWDEKMLYPHVNFTDIVEREVCRNWFRYCLLSKMDAQYNT